MTHDELVSELRATDGLRDVGKRFPNFHLRSKPFLHFHHDPEGTRADVRFDPTGDFEPAAASTAEERRALLERVRAHVEAVRA